MAKKGIDVSYANGSVDWNKAKNNIDFAIIRSSFGSDLPSQIDSYFFQNADGCKKNNIPFGTYHFAYFTDVNKAKDEADFAIRLANEYKRYVKFIALDIEEDSERYANAVGANPNWTECAVAFMERIKNAGYIPILYSNYSWIKSKFNYDKINKYKLWYAAPDVQKPYYDCAVWQYSWNGKINGINGDVDMNYLYDDILLSDSATAIIAKNTDTSSKIKTVDDKTKFLDTARKYIGVNGNYVCNTKLRLGMIVDWCAYSISSIMKDCGFIRKYQGGIYGFASDAAREDNGKYGEWFKKGTKTPQAGDYIMFRYSSFLNPIDKYSASHVGIVENVNGNTLTTLEGNVDGYGSDWAGTSIFKRKTRYLSSGDVYAFYRPYWQGEKNTTSTGTSSDTQSDIDVIYQVHTVSGAWLPDVKNLEDFAGLENRAIDGIRISVSKGHIRYRVKLIGSTSYLPWVRDREDFAGILGKKIDCIQIEFYGLSHTAQYQAEYCVSTINSTEYLPWVKNYNNKNTDGYAGIVGTAIDKLQIKITNI